MHYTKLTDRKKSMEKQLRNMLFYNFFNIHWIDQFDREVITQEIVEDNYKYDPEVLGRPITLPEIANGIAHIHIIESVYKIGLVLEDDTIFKPDFVHHLYKILKNLPPEWDSATIYSLFILCIPRTIKILYSKLYLSKNVL